MTNLDSWLEKNMDEIFNLKNENIYISAPGIRGNRYRLKYKARNYLLDIGN